MSIGFSTHFLDQLASVLLEHGTAIRRLLVSMDAERLEAWRWFR